MALHRFDPKALSAGTPRFSHPVQVLFQDVDAAGIAFYARITTWFHDAWFAFLMDGGLDLPTDLKSGPTLAPMRHTETDYFSPVRFGDRLEAEVVEVHLEGSNLTVGFRLVRAGTDESVATGQQNHVFVSRAAFERVEAPANWRSALGL